MQRRQLLVLACLPALCALLCAPQALAHDTKPGILALQETAPGSFTTHYTPPATAGASLAQVAPHYPAHCRVAPGQLLCGPEGLAGTLSLNKLENTQARVLLRLSWLGADEPHTILLDRHQPTAELQGAHPTAGSVLTVLRSYGWLGVEHILLGFDHLCFVLGLLLLVRGRRRLLATITAFTVAHSVTLALSALEVFRLPIAPVEAVIALSILLLAVECAKNRQDSLTARYPYFVAFGFGLLHGLGFASALSEIGLPPHQLHIALLSFNLGVEAGQLVMVGLALGLVTVLQRVAFPRAAARTTLIYALGTVAAYWATERIVPLLTNSLQG